MSEEKSKYTDASEYKRASEYMVECVVPGSGGFDSGPNNRRETQSFLDFLKLYQDCIDKIVNGERLPQRFLVAKGPQENPRLEQIYSRLRKCGERIRVEKAISRGDYLIEGMSLNLDAYFNRITLTRLHFRNCEFTGKLFMDSRFVKCWFINCNLIDAEFGCSSFEDCIFVNSSICSDLQISTLSGSIFNNTKFRLGVINNTSFRESRFTNHSEFIDVSFVTSDFSNCRFEKTLFEQCYFFSNEISKTFYNMCAFKKLHIHKTIQGIESNETKSVDAKTMPTIEIESLEDCSFHKCNINAKIVATRIQNTEFHNCESDLFEIRSKTTTDTIKINECSIDKLIIPTKSTCINLAFKSSKIESIDFTDARVQDTIIDFETFKTIKHVVNGYKAVNGIVLQKVHGAPNYAAEVKLLDRVDSGIGNDADTVVGNLSHSRHLYGVYLATVAIGLAALLKSYFPDDFNSLSEFPFVGKILDLELVPFLHFAVFPGIILLMVASFVNEARRWLPFINRRKEVTKVTGFSWTITQYIEPHPLKGTERSWFTKYVRELYKYRTWYSKKAVSLFIRFVLIICGPAVFTGLVYRCWECTTLPYEEHGTIIMTYHAVSLAVLWSAAFWLFWLSNQFQRPLAFNPDADPKTNPAP